MKLHNCLKCERGITISILIWPKKPNEWKQAAVFIALTTKNWKTNWGSKIRTCLIQFNSSIGFYPSLWILMVPASIDNFNYKIYNSVYLLTFWIYLNQSFSMLLSRSNLLDSIFILKKFLRHYQVPMKLSPCYF